MSLRDSLKVAVKVALVKEDRKVVLKAPLKANLSVRNKTILVNQALAKVVVVVRVLAEWNLSRETLVNQALAKEARPQVVTLAKVDPVKKVHPIKSRPVAMKLHHREETLVARIQEVAQADSRTQVTKEPLQAITIKELKVVCVEEPERMVVQVM
ncbi:MAG: hypothetical protein Q9191_004195, partial [Dirinaria sp. TL-2023a]